MYINHCTAAIIHWMRQEKQISVDDLVCDALFDEFSQSEILKSLSWLLEQKLIQCTEAPTEEVPYLLVLGGVEYSEKNWSLTERAYMAFLDADLMVIDQ